MKQGRDRPTIRATSHTRQPKRCTLVTLPVCPQREMSFAQQTSLCFSLRSANYATCISCRLEVSLDILRVDSTNFKSMGWIPLLLCTYEYYGNAG